MRYQMLALFARLCKRHAVCRIHEDRIVTKAGVTSRRKSSNPGTTNAHTQTNRARRAGSPNASHALMMCALRSSHELSTVGVRADKTPGPQPSASTSIPESSASAGPPRTDESARAFRSALSTYVDPVSATSPYSDPAATSAGGSDPHSTRSSRSFPAFRVATATGTRGSSRTYRPRSNLSTAMNAS
jgi:hypothetical protein